MSLKGDAMTTQMWSADRTKTRGKQGGGGPGAAAARSTAARAELRWLITDTRQNYARVQFRGNAVVAA